MPPGRRWGARAVLRRQYPKSGCYSSALLTGSHPKNMVFEVMPQIGPGRLQKGVEDHSGLAPQQICERCFG